MFDLQENLVKVKELFKGSAGLMLATAPINEKIIEIVNKLPKDPKKEGINFSTLQIKENRNKDAIFSGEGCNLYHSDHKYESLFKNRGLFAGVQKPDDSNKKKGILNKDFLDI